MVGSIHERSASAFGKEPLLLVLSGLPGSGKSALARRLAPRLGAAWLRIDTIEQSLRDLCGVKVEGYELAYRLAADQLRAGTSVVADSVNPIGLTRRAWHAVAESQGRKVVDVEICCSDEVEHRRRVEGRVAEVAGLRQPTWAEVRARDYEPWTDPVIRVDTASAALDESLAQLLAALKRLPQHWSDDP